MGAVVFLRYCCFIADLTEMRRENSKQNHLCAQMFDQSDELQGMKLKFPHLQIQLHLRQGSQSMSNDSASSIIIKDSKLQSMTNFPLRSAFEFPVSSQSQRVMCAKKRNLLKICFYQLLHTNIHGLLFCCLKIRLSSSRHSVMIASQRLA